MKNIFFYPIIIILGFSCSSKLKTIDNKVAKTEKKILQEKKTASLYYYLLDTGAEISFDDIDENNFDYDESTTLNVFKNKKVITKVSFEITEKKNFIEYYRKCQIYFDNEIPILITDSLKSKQVIYLTGVHITTGKLVSQMEHIILSNNKAYIEDWETFKIKSIDKDKSDYIIKNKEQYRKIMKYLSSIKTRN
jgi:hypothetical protein